MRPAIEVTQADREAAAAYYYSAGGSPNIARDIREGRKDSWFRVQAFARHRLAEREAVVKWLRKTANMNPQSSEAKSFVLLLCNAIEAGAHHA
jgi:hypothetical protein